MDDLQLLRQYVKDGSQDAFAAIVRRHVDLVYGTARRLVGDEHLAQDVAQAAFAVLAQKAKQVEPRRLAGWLVNATRLAANEARRAKLCREKHEWRAAQMRSSNRSEDGDEPTLEQLTPLLDEALCRLGEADRTAVAMRFLQGRSFAEVAAAMGSSEEAARKRVERAVEKLRGMFMKKGFAPSVGGLMVVLAAHQAQAAPAGLAGSISATAISGGAGTGAILAKGAMKMMTLAKVKVAAVVLGVFVAAAGGVVAAQMALSPTTSQSRPAGADGMMTDAVRQQACDAFASQHDNWLSIRRLSTKYRWTLKSFENGKWVDPPVDIVHSGTIDFEVVPLTPDEARKLGRQQRMWMRWHMYDERDKVHTVADDLMASRENMVHWPQNDPGSRKAGGLNAIDTPFISPYDIFGMSYRNDKWANSDRTESEYFRDVALPLRISSDEETMQLLDGHKSYLFTPSLVYVTEPSIWINADTGNLYQIDMREPGKDFQSIYRYENYLQDPLTKLAFPTRITKITLEGKGSNVKGFRYTVELSDNRINGELPPDVFK